jgi:hypothetical protein
LTFPADSAEKEATPASMVAFLRSLSGSRYPRLVVRVVLAIVCFAVAAALTVLPGPAFVFWALGFVLLGFSVGQVLMSIHAVQEFLHRRVPYADRLPRLRKGHMRSILRHRWVRALDRFSARRQARLRRRAERRAARATRRPLERSG